MTTAELLAVHRGALVELKRRGVVRTMNPPAGDWAERLVAVAYKGELIPNSGKSFDVIAEDGRRLQVKARVLAPDSVGSQSLSAIRSWDFDACVVVLFDTADLSVRAASEISCDVLRHVATFRKRTNSWSVRPTKRVMGMGVNIAPALAAAAKTI